jgi:hypothetical protein
MARLIEIQDVTQLPAELNINVGDVLWFWATGGRVCGSSGENSTTDVLRLLGQFSQAIVGPAGEIISPAGPPNTVLFLASSVGRSSIEVITGDPWREARTTPLGITVNV